MIGLSYLSIAYTIYVGHNKPWKVRHYNQVELMNEWFYAFCLYIIFTFTDITLEEKSKFDQAYLFIAVCSLFILINFVYISHSIIRVARYIIA